MRPGQLTPENPIAEIEQIGGAAGFNEAGAINPGKRIAQVRRILDARASMRPGQLTPENTAAAASRVFKSCLLQ